MRNPSGRASRAALDVLVGDLARAPRTRPRPPRSGAEPVVQVPLVDVVGPLDGDRLALLLAVGVDELFVRIRYSHALQVRALLEPGEPAVGAQVGLLHEVLGVGGVAGHPERRAVQAGQQRHHVALEPLAQRADRRRRSGLGAHHRLARSPGRLLARIGPSSPATPQTHRPCLGSLSYLAESDGKMEAMADNGNKRGAGGGFDRRGRRLPARATPHGSRRGWRSRSLLRPDLIVFQASSRRAGRPDRLLRVPASG